MIDQVVNMKIQCDVCEKAKAEVLCCADEAVLCKTCDSKVHAANKLSQKHERLFLLDHSSSSSSSSTSSSSSQLPLCDICQERRGYVFCLEDRAILCRNCDISTHGASTYVLSHRRFLIGGVKVDLHSNRIDPSSSRAPVSKEFSLDYTPDKESSATTTMTRNLEASSTETTVTFPGDDPSFITPEQQYQWSFMDDTYDSNHFGFYEFSDVESSRFDNK